MKNIALIQTIISNHMENSSKEEIAQNLVLLIQSHPENIRENVIALITNTAELTIRSIDHVQVKSRRSAFNIVEIVSAEPDFLTGQLTVRYKYEETVTRYYKTEEAATSGLSRESNYDQSENYPYLGTRINTGTTTDKVEISDWNTGSVTI